MILRDDRSPAHGGKTPECESWPLPRSLHTAVPVSALICGQLLAPDADHLASRPCLPVNAGYDGSLFNGLQTIAGFDAVLGYPDSNKLGIISAAYPLGA